MFCPFVLYLKGFELLYKPKRRVSKFTFLNRAQTDKSPEKQRLAMRVAIIRKLDTGDSVFAWRILVCRVVSGWLVLTTIVIHSWAWDNNSLTRDTPFSNTTPTRRFQRERDSGSTQPIFKTKADSVREKVHLSFAASRFLKRSVNFQKFSFENGTPY